MSKDNTETKATERYKEDLSNKTLHFQSSVRSKPRIEMYSVAVVLAASLLCQGMGQNILNMGHASQSVQPDNMHVKDTMNTVDLHTHHRCCQHDMWHGWLHESEGTIKNGSTMLEVHQVNRDQVFLNNC